MFSGWGYLLSSLNCPFPSCHLEQKCSSINLTKLSCSRWRKFISECPCVHICHMYTWAREVHRWAGMYTEERFIAEFSCAHGNLGTFGIYFLEFIAELFWNYKVNPSCLGKNNALISRIFVWWMCFNITFKSEPYVSSWLPSLHKNRCLLSGLLRAQVNLRCAVSTVWLS